MKSKTLLAFCLLFSVSSVFADEAPSTYSFVAPPKKSVVGEAARAVVGRVFGVQGEGGDIPYDVVELTEHSPVNASVRSALIPGWGQGFNGQGVKGVVFFLSFAAATAGSYFVYRSATRSYDEYKALGIQGDSSYDDYKKERSESIVLGIAAVALWLGSVVDARANAYNPVLSSNPNVELVMNQNERLLRWKKKF